MLSPMACEKFWADKSIYDNAEKKYYEYLSQPPLDLKSSCSTITTESQVGISSKDTPLFAADDSVDQVKLKKDKKRSKKNKKDASGSPDATAIVSSSEVVSSIPMFTASNASDDALKEQSKKQKSKKNRKNKTGQEVQTFAQVGTVTEKQSTDKIQRENIKNLKEKENLAHKMCDNITEELNKMNSFPAQCTLASEISKARQHIKNSLERMDGIAALAASPGAELLDRLSTVEKENDKLRSVIDGLNNLVIDLHARVKVLESTSNSVQSTATLTKSAPVHSKIPASSADDGDDDDDVDLFGSEDEEEDKAAADLREKRLAEYAAKKSKKPALIAKSNVILDIKPWDDETDMKEMENEVRKISMDGLLLGASKLVPLAYGIHKLQLSCVIEDDKVSVDELQEQIEKIEDYVQSVDIAAFNKI